MIVKREFVPFLQLMQSDPDSRDLILSVFEKSYGHMDEEAKQDCYNKLGVLSLAEREMSWAMTDIDVLVREFERLDVEKPFDSGFTYDKVNEVMLMDRDETGVTVRLVTWFDGLKRVVSVERIGKTNDE